MTQLAEKASAFSMALDKRPQGGPRWLEDLRGRGAAKFAALGIPTVRDEEWRFTNVSALGAIDFASPGPISGAAERLSGYAYTDAPLRLVIVNGRFDTTLSRTKGLPAGVVAGSLAVALKDHADVVQRYFGQLADFTSRSFDALNTAFVHDGAFVHVPDGAVLETPIHVIFVSGAEGSSVIGFDSAGSLSSRCIETIPSILPGSSRSRSAVRNLSLSTGRRRTIPSAAPRPWPRLMVMRATARIMFLKRAMFAFDQSVWLASAVR